jgi:2-C-methyl-D-erythritol 4-phosphate cytidylyltransferase
MMREDVGVVIPSGGRGERMGQGMPKQFRAIAGTPMLLRSMQPFVRHPRVRQIVIPLSHDIVHDPPPWLSQLSGSGKVHLVTGGATRAQSVRNGVVALDTDCRVILVHDAARPFVNVETIDAVIAEATAGRCAIAAIPVSDTLKRACPDRDVVAETVDRNRLWRAQTPQGFPREILTRAYETCSLDGDGPTDEAALVESAGFEVALVADSVLNLKVTTPEDLALAEALGVP